jgi:peptidoglycan hydrolase-like protein with peptidoglycan-binding domain
MRQRYTLEDDGVYGPESRRACIALQREAGLDPDGIVGPSTWAATFAEG